MRTRGSRSNGLLRLRSQAARATVALPADGEPARRRLGLVLAATIAGVDSRWTLSLSSARAAWTAGGCFRAALVSRAAAGGKAGRLGHGLAAASGMGGSFRPPLADSHVDNARLFRHERHPMCRLAAGCGGVW